MNDQTLHRKLKIEEHKHHSGDGVRLMFQSFDFERTKCT